MSPGPYPAIWKARRARKLLGGGMRQVGVLAAAGLIALGESPKILHRDHENARRLAEGLAEIRGIALDPALVRTNIVIFDVAATGHAADDFCAHLAGRGILCGPTGPASVRMVTHYDVAAADVDRALAAVAEVAAARVPAGRRA